jgi:outer membrane receptor protein involved in Fe transport
MKSNKKLIMLLIAIFTFAGLGQPVVAKITDNAKLGVINGKVIDAETQKPIEYANVRLFSMSDSSLVTGTITSVDGVFTLKKIPVGEYYVEISFIGFEKLVKTISITKEKLEFSLNDIVLSAQSQQLEGVTVVGEKTHIKYEIDKQVINVGKDATAAGGSAVEVLENTPSVQVNVDGDVSLRGSQDFTVLINGKPTQLSGTDALKQIPASSIEKIELITNPSAKYEAEGLSGIINIITKKNTMMGFNGLVNTTIGTGHKYSTNGTFNFRKKRLNLFTGFELSENYNSTDIGQASVVFSPTNNYYQNSSIHNVDMQDAMVFTFGFDYDINDKNSLSIQGKGGRRGYDDESESNSYDYTDLEPTKNNKYSYRYFDVYGEVMEYTLDYKNKIGENHEFTITGHYQSWNGFDAEDLRATVGDSIDEMHYYKKNDFNYQTRINADYKRPLGKKGILEAGYQFKFNDRNEDFNFDNYDANTGEMIYDPTFSNELKYRRYIHAGYAAYASEFKGFRYKVGIRGEYTDRRINIDTESTEEQDYVMNNQPDWFPSIHVSRDLKNGHSLQASYSRRITRPNAWLLNNNPKYFDANNIFYGSPNLLPQYTDSYELNYRKPFKKVFVSVQTYYRYTTNGFTQERKPIEGSTNKFSHQLINNNNQQALGAELMNSIEVTKWLKVNIGGNLFNRTEEGIIDGTEQSVSDFSWNAFTNANFNLKHGTRFQLTVYYSAPEEDLYGYRTPIYVLNLGANKSFFKGKLTAGISARDVLNTLKFDYEAKDALGNSTYTVEPEGPKVSLNLSYRINNFKNKQRGKKDDNEFSGSGF